MALRSALARVRRGWRAPPLDPRAHQPPLPLPGGFARDQILAALLTAAIPDQTLAVAIYGREGAAARLRTSRW